MKVLVLLGLIGLVAAGDDLFGEKAMTRKWKEAKIWEGCYTKDGFKFWMLKYKQAVAKCSDKDMPELDLPTVKSPFKLIKAFLDGAEESQKEQMVAMFGAKMAQPPIAYVPYPFMHQQSNSHHGIESMLKRMVMKKIVKKIVKSKQEAEDDDDESEEDLFSYLFDGSRQKRQADDSLGDRLAEKLKMKQEAFQKKMGMVKCVLTELNVIKDDMELDKEGMEECIDEMKMEDEWFVERQKKDLNICYQIATNLPQVALDDCEFGPAWAKIKAFFSCEEKRKIYTCMAKDAKEMVEENFGKLENLVEETSMKEDSILLAAWHILEPDMD